MGEAETYDDQYIREMSEMNPIKLCFLMVITADNFDRSKLNPADYFGMEDDIKAVLADHRAAKVEFLRRVHMPYYPKTPLADALIREQKQLCAIQYAIACDRIDDMNKSWAKRVLSYDKNVCGSLSVAIKEKAMSILGIVQENGANANADAKNNDAG